MTGNHLLAGAVVFTLLVLALLMLILLLRNKKEILSDGPADPGTPARKKPLPCPICGAALNPGERIHSVRFPQTGEYALMHIFGCPYCWTEHPRRADVKTRRRNCPSCRSLLADKDHLIAKIYKKPGRDHVSVVGCTLCR